MIKNKIPLTEQEAIRVADSEFRTSVLSMGLRVMVYSILMYTLTEVILLDAQRTSRQFSEQSFTEYGQEIALFISSLLFYLSVRHYPRQAVVGLLLGGFLGMALIREFDAFLDENISRHAWKVMAYSLALLTAVLVYKRRNTFWQPLHRFINSKAFGFVMAGLLVVFIFSRFYGLRTIWLALMGEEDFNYEITRISEESVELLGYTLIMIGAIEHLIGLRNSTKGKASV